MSIFKVIDGNTVRCCDVCEEPFEKDAWGWRHNFHEVDCENFVSYEDHPNAGQPCNRCDCDNVCHPGCCPQCNKEIENKMRAGEI